MAVFFVDSGDGLYTRLFSFCIGLHIISSLRNDNSGVFVGVCACVTHVIVNTLYHKKLFCCCCCCSLVKNEMVQSTL